MSLGSKLTVPLPLPLQVDEFSLVVLRLAALLSLLGSGVVGSGRVGRVSEGVQYALLVSTLPFRPA